MSEIMMHSYTKKVMRYGIPKRMAQEIVSVSFETCKGKNLEVYMKYAISLAYGLSI